MSSTFDTFAPRQLTRDYFVGREQERERIRQLARSLVGLRLGEQPTLLQFYGVGGIGKTALLRQVVDDLKVMRNEGGAKSHLRNLHLPHLLLDHQQWTPQSLPEDFLWWLRCALARAPVPTPLFDCLYFMLWRMDHPGQTFSLESHVPSFLHQAMHTGADWFDATFGWSIASGKVLSDAAEHVGGFVEASCEAAAKGAMAFCKTSIPALDIFRSFQARRKQGEVINLLGFDPRCYERREQLWATTIIPFV